MHWKNDHGGEISPSLLFLLLYLLSLLFFWSLPFPLSPPFLSFPLLPSLKSSCGVWGALYKLPKLTAKRFWCILRRNQRTFFHLHNDTFVIFTVILAVTCGGSNLGASLSQVFGFRGAIAPWVGAYIPSHAVRDYSSSHHNVTIIIYHKMSWVV